MLNVANIIVTEVEGPGRRMAIWFQGCLKNCQGCCNQDMIPIKPANIVSEEWLIEYIQNRKKKLKALPFLVANHFYKQKVL